MYKQSKLRALLTRVQLHLPASLPCAWNFRAVVVKTVRLNDGVPNPQYNTSGVDVVQLVRDPRGVTNSQLKLWKKGHSPEDVGRK